MGGRINTIMQTCFFAISGVLPRDEAIAQIKKAIEKTYGKKGAEVVKRNFAAVDAALENLHEIPAGKPSGSAEPHLTVPGEAPDFVQKVTAVMIEGKGDLLPGQRLPGGRHLAHRHRAVGEAGHRPGDPGLGRHDLHPVQQVRARLPARRDPRQGLRAGRPRGRARDLQVRRLQGPRVRGPQVHHPGRARGLHRLQALRR